MDGPATVRISNLPRTPEAASAVVTVVSSDGRRTEVELTQEDIGCDLAGSMTLGLDRRRSG